MIPIRSRTVFCLALVLAVLAATRGAFGQTGACPTSTAFATAPTRGCFFPVLAEHNATDPVTGAPNYMVARYDILYFAEGANVATATPVTTTAIGKPAPNAQGAIWFGAGTATPLPAYPLGQRLKAVVVAVGPGGLASPRGATNTSNPFGQSTPAPAPAAPSGMVYAPD